MDVPGVPCGLQLLVRPARLAGDGTRRDAGGQDDHGSLLGGATGREASGGGIHGRTTGVHAQSVL